MEVVLIAGSPGRLSRSAVLPDYALAPVLAALKTRQILRGVFADDSQVACATSTKPAYLDSSLIERLDHPLEQFCCTLHPMQNMVTQAVL